MAELESSRPLRILVVDDYPDAGTSLRILLELFGHEVRDVLSGKEALKVARSFQPQVVFLDIEMPGMHGGEVARMLRRMPGLGNLWIVATSGTDLDDTRLAGYQYEFDDYLPKPYSPERLERLVACCVAATLGESNGLDDEAGAHRRFRRRGRW